MIRDFPWLYQKNETRHLRKEKEEIPRQGNFLASLELAKTRKITYEHLLADVEYRLSIQID